MKHTWKAAVAVAALAGSAGVAKADLTLSGQTGMFINPTAEIVQKSAPEVGVDYQRRSDYGYDYNHYGVHGAARLADRLELNGGLTRDNLGSGYRADSWHVGAKYKVLDRIPKGFDVAVGGDYQKYKENFGYREKDYFLYAAATKSFKASTNRPAIQGTVGVRWDKSNGNDGFSDSKSSVYAGVQVPLTSTGEWSAIGELGTKRFDNTSSVYSLGVRYHPNNSGFSVGAGVARQYTKSGFFAQLGYQFGK